MAGGEFTNMTKIPHEAQVGSAWGDAMQARRLPASVNIHIWKHCNQRCRYCFAHFNDDLPLRSNPDGLGEQDWMAVLERLREAGAEKVNFAGGEPTLHPALGRLLRHAKAIGFATSVVSNGARLGQLLDTHAAYIDWIGLSVDSSCERTQQALGRGTGRYVEQMRCLALKTRELGVRLKLNTVVNAWNCDEDMGDLVCETHPERWKLFQVLPIRGQNEGAVDALLITKAQFRAFVDRHRYVEARGVRIVPELNTDMMGSYAMIDPLGRFFSNASARHAYSPPILEAGVLAAFDQISFSADAYRGRGGVYDWHAVAVPSRVTGPVRAVPLAVIAR
jgi:radical S-adenosyl methionine domain-containing protein 2